MVSNEALRAINDAGEEFREKDKEIETLTKDREKIAQELAEAKVHIIELENKLESGGVFSEKAANFVRDFFEESMMRSQNNQKTQIPKAINSLLTRLSNELADHFEKGEAFK